MFAKFKPQRILVLIHVWLKAFQSREGSGGQGETLVLHIVQLHLYINMAPCNLPMESLVGCFKKGLVHSAVSLRKMLP